MAAIKTLIFLSVICVLLVTGYYSEMWWYERYPDVVEIKWLIVLVIVCMPCPTWLAVFMYLFEEEPK